MTEASFPSIGPAVPVDLAAEDRAARLLAVTEFARPVALEAGAGTGKTRSLVARLATWLLGPGWERAARELADSPSAARRHGSSAGDSEIAARAAEGAVAITFTEAAAAEMAKRLGELLAKLAAAQSAKDLDPPPEILDGVDLPHRARALAAVLSRLRVQTIHGFCHALLAEHPFEGGLHPALEVDADGARLSEAAREALLARLRARERSVTDLIATGVDPVEMHEAVLALVSQGAQAIDLAEPRFTSGLCAALLDPLAKAIRALQPRLDALAAAAGNSKTTRRAADALPPLLAQIEADGDPIERLAAAAQLVRELSEEWQPAFERWRDREPNKTEVKKLGEDLETFLAAAAPLGDRLVELATLDPVRFEAARLALGPLLEETRLRLRRAGALGFDDLLAESASLLDRNAGVRRRVRRSIRQLLVDEFQDTDRRQCAILEALAFGDADGERPGFFVVGDPKQSIYAWRSADLAAYEQFLGALRDAGGVTGRLSMNFRSAPPILAEVERSVAPAMRPEPGVQPAFERLIAGPLTAGRAGFGRGGRSAVEFWVTCDSETARRGKAPSAGRAAEIEASAIAADIAALATQQAVNWSEFALLLRTRSDLETYLDALRRAGIPYAVQKDRSYYRRREVIDLVSLVRAILDPGDTLALIGALRSPFVGVPDAAWTPLWSVGFPNEMAALDSGDPDRLAGLGELIRRAARETPRDIPGLAALGNWPAALLEASVAIGRLRAEWSQLPVGLWLERLRARFLVEPVAAARYLGRFGLANIERLFVEIEERLGEAADPLHALAALRRAVEEEEKAEEARPPDAGQNAVAVMTIHTAKGLEFGHVYLPQIHKRPRSGDRVDATAFVAAERSTSSDSELLLFGAPSPGWSAAKASAARAREAEIARLLYVAMTRAKERLVICGVWPAAAGASSGNAFVDLLANRRPDDLAVLLQPDGTGRLSDTASWRRIDESALAGNRSASSPYEVTAADVVAPCLERIDRESARARQSRPRFAYASGLAIERSDAEETAEEHGNFGATGRDRARARGVALHRALELEPLARDSAGDWGEAVRAAYLSARGVLDVEERAALETDLERLTGSHLWRRLAEIGPDTLGRELPVALSVDPADTDGPIDGVLGTLDLLYLDLTTGETVVADFKSDPAPESEADGVETWIESRRERYRPQLECYGRAVQRALALPTPPRLELWLLAVDRIVAIEPAAGS